MTDKFEKEGVVDLAAVRMARSGDGGGPEDPMLLQRVERLEADVAEIRNDVKEINRRIGGLEERLARMEGGFAAIDAKLDALPTVWTFTIGVIGTVCAVLAITLGLR
jgi:hypothetical protein